MNLRSRLLATGMALTLIMSGTSTLALATPQSELAEVSAQLETMGAELSSLQDDLAAKTSDLEMTSYHIGEKEAAITQTQGELAAAKAILSERMRSSYKSGTSSLLSVIVGADSLNDIISRIYYMDKVATSDAQTINQVRTLEERLRTEKDDLEKTKAQQQKSVDELQVQVDDYTAKVDEARAYYEALDEQVRQQLAAQAAAASANVQAAMEVVGEQTQQAQTTTNAEATDTQDQQQTATQSDDSGSSSTSSGGGESYAPSGGGLGSAYAAIGSPYVYGADGPTSFDCSGLVCYCYGYARGRTTYDMISSLQSTGSWKTSMDQLSVGDLVFTDEGHVGIYTGGGTMIHAPRPGKSVCETSVWSFIGGGSY